MVCWYEIPVLGIIITVKYQFLVLELFYLPGSIPQWLMTALIPTYRGEPVSLPTWFIYIYLYIYLICWREIPVLGISIIPLTGVHSPGSDWWQLWSPLTGVSLPTWFTYRGKSSALCIYIYLYIYLVCWYEIPVLGIIITVKYQFLVLILFHGTYRGPFPSDWWPLWSPLTGVSPDLVYICVYIYIYIYIFNLLTWNTSSWY